MALTLEFGSNVHVKVVYSYTIVVPSTTDLRSIYTPSRSGVVSILVLPSTSYPLESSMTALIDVGDTLPVSL